MADPSEDARIGDLVAVEVQDRQNHAVCCRVQEFVGMPACRQRSGLRLAVADDTGNDQVRVVEGCSVGVGDSVAELPAFVNGTGRLRGHMAWNAARERELREEPFHALLIGGDVRVNLAVGSLEIGVRDQARPAMPGSSNVDHVQVVLLDEPVQVDIDEVQTWSRSPMAEQPRLDVFLCQGLLEQGVVVKIDLADRQVVRRSPVRIHQSQLIVR